MGRNIGTVSFVVGLLLATVVAGPRALASDAGYQTESPDLTLIVGSPDEMKIRNLLPARANDPWTSDVLFRIYDRVQVTHPTEDRPMAWIAKGVDSDEDGRFETTEYDVWGELAGATTPLRIVVYYDFNGVRWHDGAQMTPWDLFFSFHIDAMNPRFNTDLRVLFPLGMYSGYEPERQLNVRPFDADGDPANGFQHAWEGESGMPGGMDSPLRMGVEFTLTAPFALFYESTISPIMLPMHLWSTTGGGRHTDTSPPPGPDDYGCAIWLPPSEAIARGLPECGNVDPTRHGDGIGSTETVPGSRPFHYLGAESWSLVDQDVIGHGPFKTLHWIPNVEATVVRNEDFYTGLDDQGTPEPGDDISYDPRLSRILINPTITGIRFKVYTTTQVALFALQNGEIDFYHGNIGAEFLEELQKIPEIAIEANAEPGFYYMGYNLRKATWGYERNDPSQDVGYGFRQAVSHVIDKRQIVQNLLQNYGVIGHGVISPANTFWYNDNIPKPTYDLARASAILDDLATPGGDYYDPRFSLDPSGVCDRSSPGGCRSLPIIGNESFDILTPAADYDPIRAAAGAMIADAFRQVGINAHSKPTAFSEIVASVNERSFDMYILGWRFSGTDPDYLFSLFHSSNAGVGGQNHPGFQNATFDGVIEASRVELDRDVRRTHIFQAQEILADARPYEVLYYRTNVEAYRQDRFINWTVDGGTIWNWWSLIGIHPPASPTPYTIRVDSAPSNLQVSVDRIVRTAPYDHVCYGGSVEIGTLDLQGAGDTRHLYDSWSDGGAQYHDVPCDANATYTVSFLTQHRFTVDTDPPGLTIEIDGVLHLAPFSFWCDEASQHALYIPGSTDPGGHTREVFSTWSDGNRDNPRVVMCDAPEIMKADIRPQYRIIVESAPAPLEIEVDGVRATAPHTLWCNPGESATLNAPSPQIVGSTRYLFETWSDGGPQTHEVACDSPATYSALFAKAYRITIEANVRGLQVEVDGVPRPVPHTFWCPAGSAFDVGALSPQSGTTVRHLFVSWSDGQAAAHTITCSGSASYAATFALEYLLAFQTSPEGLPIIVGGTASPTPFTRWCTSGSTLEIAAPSVQGDGSERVVFRDWSDGGTVSHIVTCNQPSTLTATFDKEYRFRVASNLAGATLNVDGTSVTAPFATWCQEGTTVHLEAPSETRTNGAAYRFTAWSDGGGRVNEVPCAAPVTVTAMYDEVPFPQRSGVVVGLGLAVILAALVMILVAFRLRRRRQGREDRE